MWRELVLAAGGIVILVAGCPELDVVLDPCRSQCELAAGGCEEQPIEDFEDFATTAEAWREELEDLTPTDTNGDGNQDLPFVYAGQCADGTLFLYRGTGFTVLIHFFDAESEEFVALRTGTDVVDPVCSGRGYWPERVECENATVTEAIVGAGFAAGDPIELL